MTVEANHRLISDLIAEEQRPDSRGSCSLRTHPAQGLMTPGTVVSVWGNTSEQDMYVPFFAQKEINYDGELSRVRHRLGVMSHRGHKPDMPNQDDFFVLARADSVMLGVLDGHGSAGHEVSHWAQERLPSKVWESLKVHGRDQFQHAVTSSVEELCQQARETLGEKAVLSGCTMSLLMLDTPSSGAPMRIRCGYLGDSTAVVASRRSNLDGWEITVLTNIHRPDREDELARIESVGGSIDLSHGADCARLLAGDWNLAVSRSFCDFHAVEYGLSNVPEFSDEVTLDPAKEHLILVCSDGVWDVIPPALAVNIVGKFKPEEAQLAVERLITKSQLRWQEMGDVVDDITAILLWPVLGDGLDSDVSKPQTASSTAGTDIG